MNDTGHSKAEHERQLDGVIAEYFRRVEGGEQIDRQKWISNFPHLADELRSFFESADLAERLAGKNAPPDSSSSLTGLETLPPDAIVESESLTENFRRDDPAPPQRFGRYEIVRTLGRGAMGVVYLAVDSQLGRKVALKVPTPAAHDSEEILRRFYREAKAAATLSHPNICSVYDVDQVDGTHYIAMEYIDGKPLSSYVSPERPMDERNAARVIRKLAQALSHAHQRGIIHRDLKPSNVMIGPRHEPIVTDFGLARQVNNRESIRMTQSGMLIGTPAYMPPEQVEGDIHAVGPASDVYSLGVIFYELLTGQLPFQGPVAAVLAQIVSKDPDKPSTLRPDLDRRLETICLTMMSKPIGKRFASMDEVAAALTQVLKTPEQRTGADASTRQTQSGSQKLTVLTTSDAQALCRTARKCVEAHDYEQAVQLLEQIPDRFHDDTIEQLLEEATELNDEVHYLLASIEEADKRQDYNGLLPSVERLLELKPGHRQAFAIYKKLTTVGFKSSIHGSRRRSSHRGSGEIPGYVKLIAAAAAFVALIAGVITFSIRTGYVTVKVVIDDSAKADNVSVRIDGDRIEIANIGETIRLKPGDHELEIRRGNVVAVTRDFRIVRGKTDILKITLEEERPVEIASKKSQSKQDALTNTSVATKVTTNVVEPIVAKPTLPTTADLNHEADSPAQITTKDAVPRILEESDDEKGWRTVPYSLKGAQIYDQWARPTGGMMEFEVTQSGIVDLACTFEYEGNASGGWKEQALTHEKFSAKGWKQVAELRSGNGGIFAVVSRPCTVGERFLIRCNKYTPPIVLLLPKAGQKEAAQVSAEMLVAPFDEAAAKKARSAWAAHLKAPEEVTNSVGMKLALIPAGAFIIGSPESEEARYHDREQQHIVEITTPFYLGVYEVTQAEYEKVIGKNPSYFSPSGDGKDRVSGQDTTRFPAESVSWDNAKAFCEKLSQMEGKSYRLPTEAEWEYACRAGTTTTFCFGSELNGEQANVHGTTPYGTAKKGPDLSRTTAVGSYQPNAFGLFDMHGNVGEWCADWYASDYQSLPRQDPTGPKEGSFRVVRAGSWDYPAGVSRAACRAPLDPQARGNDLGFRIVLNP